ncbi:MAG TPA: hypothetical protein VEC60_03015 [Reyranella sp.]|nr:hypothetical protein [Reyranella sp.]
MPTFLVKVTNNRGWVKPPILTNCANEHEAARLVAAMGDEGDQVEVREAAAFAMRVAFGEIAPGSAVFRYDWIWPPEGGDPRPFSA